MLVAAALTVPSPALSAEVTTGGQGVDLLQFRPAGGSWDLLGLHSGRVTDQLDYGLGLTFDWADSTLVYHDGVDGTADVVETQATLNLQVSLVAFDWLELAIAAPFVVNQTLGPAAALDPRAAAAQEGFLLGDVRATLKLGIVDSKSVSLGLSTTVGLPTGGDFTTHDGLWVAPRLALDIWASDSVRLMLNAGARIREERTFANITLGNELLAGAGLEVGFGSGGASSALIATAQGFISLAAADREELGIEFLGAYEWRGLKDVAVTIGGGTAVAPGYGMPDYRALIGIRYADRGCGLGAEDMDGFQDDDRCLDADNDMDGIEDGPDLCPNEPETVNGWLDSDGCPDEINPYAVVEPNGTGGEPAPAGEPIHAPTGFALPDPPDSDGDGLDDGVDACPHVAEDIDGFQDSDGCPELDNDGDRIPDSVDKCPDAAEVINNERDDDGCPDPTPPKVLFGDDTLIVLEPVEFERGTATIKPASFDMLAQVTTIVRTYQEIKVLQVEGHTDDSGSANFNKRLSQKRAESVRKHLIEAGIAARRILAMGYGEERPISPNDSSENRAKNRRVEFRILEMDDARDHAP